MFPGLANQFEDSQNLTKFAEISSQITEVIPNKNAKEKLPHIETSNSIMPSCDSIYDFTSAA